MVEDSDLVLYVYGLERRYGERHRLHFERELFICDNDLIYNYNIKISLIFLNEMLLRLVVAFRSSNA